MGLVQQGAERGIIRYPASALLEAVDCRELGKGSENFVPKAGDGEAVVVELGGVVLQTATEAFAPVDGVGRIAVAQLADKGCFVVGGVKSDGRQLKNKYPSGLRI